MILNYSTSAHDQCQTIDCGISTIRLRKDGILAINIKEDEDLTLKEFNQINGCVNVLDKDKRFYNLINLGAGTVPNHAVREMAANREVTCYRRADAFVIHSQSQHLVANFYLQHHKPKVPTKFFSSEEDALLWLYEQVGNVN